MSDTERVVVPSGSGISDDIDWSKFVVGTPPPDALWYRCLHEPTADARIVATPDTLGGSPRFDGTRLPISLILDLLAEGVEPDKIEDMYPGLPDGWHALLKAVRPLLRSKWRVAL